MLEILRQQLADVGGLALRDVFVDLQNDQLREFAAHRLAQHAEHVRRGDDDQLLQLMVDPTRFQSQRDLARELVRLLVARAVLALPSTC